MRRSQVSPRASKIHGMHSADRHSSAFGWRETLWLHLGDAQGSPHTMPGHHLTKESEPLSNIRTVARNQIILFNSSGWRRLFGLEAGGWSESRTLVPLHPQEQTEGRNNNNTCKQTHSAAKQAQLHQVKEKSLAEPLEEEGIERRMRRKIESFFNFRNQQIRKNNDFG